MKAEGISMTLFLTSSPCVIGAPRVILNPVNGFVDRLRDALPRWPRMLVVAADPEDHAGVCNFANEMVYTLREYGMACGGFHVLDGHNGEAAARLVGDSDLIVLMGGHVPTQNAFFQAIGLRKILADYTGVVMGISAGSMNCADVVYAQPEESGESIDPGYQRYIPGLGLTDVNILPHYQQVRNNILDGRRLYEDITYGDSMGHTFYILVDGSYYYQDNETAAFFGLTLRLRDGIPERLCGEEEYWVV